MFLKMFCRTLAIALSFDIQLSHEQTTRHPKVDDFIGSIENRLKQAIDLYEKTPLGSLYRTVGC